MILHLPASRLLASVPCHNRLGQSRLKYYTAPSAVQRHIVRLCHDPKQRRSYPITNPPLLCKDIYINIPNNLDAFLNDRPPTASVLTFRHGALLDYVGIGCQRILRLLLLSQRLPPDPEASSQGPSTRLQRTAHRTCSVTMGHRLCPGGHPG